MTVPITILTGFLGSGKTTLLNHALRSPLLARALVIVNELGEVPLDHLLVKDVKEDVLLLESGCVCCSVRGDLVRTLEAEAPHAAAGRFDRVLVETTGLADPTPIVATLVRHEGLAPTYHLDAVVTAVDSELGAATLREHEEAQKQVLLADDLVLTKGDRVTPDAAAAAREAAVRLNARARIFGATMGVLDWRPLLEWTPSTLLRRLDADPPGAALHAGGAVRAFSVRVDCTVDFRSFAMWLSMVTQFHGEMLLRVKGLLRVAGEPGPVVVHSVQHVVYPAYAMARWPSEDHGSRLTVLTRGMDPALVQALRKSLEEAMTGQPARDSAVNVEAST